jgi:hypothetical protein
MQSRTANIILGLAFLGLSMAAGPAAAQTVIDLGADAIHAGHGRRHADVEVSVTTRGDTAIIIRRNSGFDSLRFNQESDIVRTGESITIDADQTVGGDVVSIGGSITVLGRVRGDVVAIGGEVTVKDGGRVDGDAVSIGGRVNREPGSHIGGQNVGMSFVPAGIFAPRGGTRGPIAILKSISLLILAIVVLKMLFVLGIGWAARALAHSNMDQFGHRVAEGPWRALFVGLGAHFALVVLIVLLSITGIGLVVTIPAGIALVPVSAISLSLIAALLGQRVGRGRIEGAAASRSWTGSAAIGLGMLFLPVVLGLLLLGTGGIGTVIAVVLLFFGGTVLKLAEATGFGAIVLALLAGRRRAPLPPPGPATPPPMQPPPTPPPPTVGPPVPAFPGSDS